MYRISIPIRISIKYTRHTNGAIFYTYDRSGISKYFKETEAALSRSSVICHIAYSFLSVIFPVFTRLPDPSSFIYNFHVLPIFHWWFQQVVNRNRS